MSSLFPLFHRESQTALTRAAGHADHYNPCNRAQPQPKPRVTGLPSREPAVPLREPLFQNAPKAGPLITRDRSSTVELHDPRIQSGDSVELTEQSLHAQECGAH